MPLDSRPDFWVHSQSLRALFSLNNMAVEKDLGGGRSCSQLLKGSFNFTFNRKIKSVTVSLRNNVKNDGCAMSLKLFKTDTGDMAHQLRSLLLQRTQVQFLAPV